MRLVLTLAFLTALAGPAAGQCVGDCSGDQTVAVNELVTGVGIALGSGPLAACPSFDADGDGQVAIAELVSAVNLALAGCATATPTPSASATPSATPTVTATPAIGPEILYFGMTAADDAMQMPDGHDPHGVPIYARPFGFSFSLVVEAQRGTSGAPVGKAGLVEGGAPDIQVQVTRDLGDGSPAVCDGAAPLFGGVPGVDPPQLEDPAAIAGPLNDLGCRFIDGSGQPVGRICAFGCVRFESGEFGCQSGLDAEVQFCAPVPMSLAFPLGDTLVTARVRDQAGHLGAPRQLIVRVAAK